MAQLNVLCLLAVLACTSQVWAGSPDRFCTEKFPNIFALVCYKDCPSGYKGVGPVCWAKCPANTIDIGAICIKKTYTRATKLPRKCGTGREPVAGFCAKVCESGYKDIGVACSKKCSAGYTDLGVTCFRSPKIKGRSMSGCSWLKKRTCNGSCGKGCDSGFSKAGCWCKRSAKTMKKTIKSKGTPTALKCASGEEKQIGLCYPECSNSYKGVLNVCWARCSGNTKDTGTQCQKKTELRKGILANCFSLPTCASFDTRCDPFYETFKKAKGVGGKIATSVCAAMYLMIRRQIETIKTFSKCIAGKNWNTVSVSLSVDAAVAAAGVVEYGIAVDTTSNKGICFVGYCYGVTSDAEVGGSINFGIWKSMGSIPGESKVYSVGADVPYLEIGVAGSAVLANPSKEFVGVVGSVGIGVGLNAVSSSVYRCDTPQKLVTEFTQAN